MQEYPYTYLFYLLKRLHLQGLTHVVVAPGSRVAPITLGFARTNGIQLFQSYDERSAAYMALGMAQSLGKPVAVCCTSGTAAANFLPAITEAWYQQIPLLAITADRPPEWIDQQDNQAIRQKGLFHRHVKYECELPVSFISTADQLVGARLIDETWHFSANAPYGPVHINVPIREPFYPPAGYSYTDPKSTKPIYTSRAFNFTPGQSETKQLEIALKGKNVLLLVGQKAPDSEFGDLIKALNLPILSEHLSNYPNDGLTGCPDLIPYDLLNPDFIPDIVIQFGLGIVSKALKEWIRELPNSTQHWVVGQHLTPTPDTFLHLTLSIPCKATEVLPILSSHKNSPVFEKGWKLLKIPVKPEEDLDSDIGQIHKLTTKLEQTGIEKLHLGNSLTVRQVLAIPVNESLSYFSNRGTSGIDGSVSTAIGHALANPSSKHALILGDMSFVYDSNAFWTAKFPQNLQVVVIQNSGGRIFERIKGPKEQPELDQLFVTNNFVDLELLAKAYGLTYEAVKDVKKAKLTAQVIEIAAHNWKPGSTKLKEEIRQQFGQVLKKC